MSSFWPSLGISDEDDGEKKGKEFKGRAAAIQALILSAVFSSPSWQRGNLTIHRSGLWGERCIKS